MAASVLGFGFPQAGSAAPRSLPAVSNAPALTQATGLRAGAMPTRAVAQRALRLPLVTGGPHLNYYGGHVVSNIHVVQVLYGNGTYTPEVQNTASPSIATFYGGVTNSAYFDWLHEYNTTITAQNGQPGTQQVIGRGSFVQQIQITPSLLNSGPTVDDTNLQAELKAQVAAGHLPQPDGNTYFAVYFPKNVTITMGGSASGVQFCAYHGTTSSPEFYYGVLPDFTTGGMTTGCGGGTRFQNETSVSSHELVETTTDAEVGLAATFAPPLAWYDPQGNNGEIGDICNGQQSTVVGGDGVTYTVQKEWSNAQNACVTHGTAPANDFSISANPTSVSVVKGNSGTSTISTALTSGSAQSITLGASGLPTGATAGFSANPVNSGASSTLTLGTAASTPAGNYTITVTGTAASGSHTTSVTLTVTNPVTNDFSISATNASATQGSSGTSTVSTTIISGAAQSVTLSASGLPAGATAAFSPNPINSGGSSTLTITTTASTPTGTSTVTVTGTGTSATHSASLTFTVNAPPVPDFTISLAPTSLTVAAGSGGTSAVSTTQVTAPGTVALTVSGAPSGVTASVSPTSVAAGSGSTLTISTTSGAAAGTYSITVTGTEGSKTHFAVLSLTVTSTSGGGITNGGFETGSLAGWTSTGTASVVSSGAQAGTYAARVGSTSPSTDSSIAQTFTVPAGGTGISFYYNVTCPDTITYDWASATLKDNTTNTTATVLPNTCVNPSSGWKQVTSVVTAGHSYTLTLSNHDDNYAGDPTYTLYDSVTITSTPPPPAGITNGGFETGSLSGWTSAGAHSAVSTTAHSGTYSAMLGNTTPTNGDSTLTQTFTASAGSTQLGLWYKMTCPDTVTYDWATVTLKDNTTNTTSTLLAKTCTTNAWTHLTGAVTAGHSYTLTLLSHDDNYGADPSYTLFDDVALS